MEILCDRKSQNKTLADFLGHSTHNAIGNLFSFVKACTALEFNTEYLDFKCSVDFLTNLTSEWIEKLID